MKTKLEIFEEALFAYERLELFNSRCSKLGINLSESFATEAFDTIFDLLIPMVLNEEGQILLYETYLGNYSSEEIVDLLKPYILE